MTIDRRKLVLAALVSAVLLIILLFGANFSFPDLSRMSPVWLAAVAAAHLLMITARGLSLRALAPESLRGARLRWVQLAARHQGIFAVLPAGIGDVGFPYLAKRISGLELPVALRLLARFRLRDAIIVAMLALAGMMLVGFSVTYGLLAITLAVPLLWFCDDLAMNFLHLMTAIAPGSRIIAALRYVAQNERPTTSDRVARTALPILVWSASVAAAVAAFRAIGVQIGIGEAMLFVAAVNIAGAVKISIAGLGVSEAGATAALVAAGSTIERAASLALLARPLLLLSVVSLSLILDLAAATMTSQQNSSDSSTP